jgi:hypothetical protein
MGVESVGDVEVISSECAKEVAVRIYIFRGFITYRYIGPAIIVAVS